MVNQTLETLKSSKLVNNQTAWNSLTTKSQWLPAMTILLKLYSKRWNQTKNDLLEKWAKLNTMKKLLFLKKLKKMMKREATLNQLLVM